MKIRENKWHYKLYNILLEFPMWLEYKKDYSKIEKHKPRSLCGYFWTIVGMLFLILAIAILAIVLLPIWLPLFGVICLCSWLSDRHREKKARKREAFIDEHGYDAWYDQYYFGKKTEPKDPNMLWEYIKAVKSKACPLIEIVPDEK